MEKGAVVISKAGHDKKGRMVVVQVLNEREVLVMDGKTRIIEHLKKKNIKHLQKTNQSIDMKEVERLNNHLEINAYVRKELKMLGN